MKTSEVIERLERLRADAEDRPKTHWLPQEDREALTQAIEILKRAEDCTRPAHACRCSQCNHEWTTNQYPSPCPECAVVWT